MRVPLVWILAAVYGIFIACPTFGRPQAPTGFVWELIEAISDEFDEPLLNKQKWRVDNDGVWSGRLPSQFSSQNVDIFNGTLMLRSTVRTSYDWIVDPISDLGQKGAFEEHWVDSSRVFSTHKIAQSGCYYECRMKASDTAMSSSFWFRMSNFSEIDVIEHIGRATKGSSEIIEKRAHSFDSNTHVFGGYDEEPNPMSWTMPKRGRDDFATYGLFWETPELLRFYYNDAEVMTSRPQVPFNEDLTMIFDTETLFSHGVGLPTIESLRNESRNAMQVDWVRAYRLAEVESGRQ